MPNSPVPDAASRLLVAHKRKAAAMVLDRHKPEAKGGEDLPSYSIDTRDLERALHKGVERLCYLREVQAATEEQRIKDALPSQVNRAFREQSSWWLPKQDLPKSWGPGQSTTIQLNSKSAAAAAAARVTQATAKSKELPTTTPAPLQRSGASMINRYENQTDVALALGTVATELALQQASVQLSGGSTTGIDEEPTSPRLASVRARLASARRSQVQGMRTVAFSGDGVDTAAMAQASANLVSAGAAATAPGVDSDRVAWAQRSRRVTSTSGVEAQGGAGAPVLSSDVSRSGGGCSAVPSQLGGTSRYKVNLFAAAQQLFGSQQESGGFEQESQIVLSEEEEEEEEDEQQASDKEHLMGLDGMISSVLGTGFLALADEDPRLELRRIAVNTGLVAGALADMAVKDAVARVAESDAMAKGRIGPNGGAFAMVGMSGGGVKSPTVPTLQPGGSPASPTRRGRAHTTTFASTVSDTPDRQAQSLWSTSRSSPGTDASPRASGSGQTSEVGANSTDSGGGRTPQRGSANSMAATVGNQTFTPTPPQQTQGRLSNSSLRLGGRTQRIVRRESATSHRGSAPGSPLIAGRTILSGRMRTATSSSSIFSSVSGGVLSLVDSAPLRSEPFELRANQSRIPSAPVPGGDEDSTPAVANSGGVVTPFRRHLLAPTSSAPLGASSSGKLTEEQSDVPVQGPQATDPNEIPQAAPADAVSNGNCDPPTPTPAPSLPPTPPQVAATTTAVAAGADEDDISHANGWERALLESAAFRRSIKHRNISRSAIQDGGSQFFKVASSGDLDSAAGTSPSPQPEPPVPSSPPGTVLSPDPQGAPPGPTHPTDGTEDPPRPTGNPPKLFSKSFRKHRPASGRASPLSISTSAPVSPPSLPLSSLVSMLQSPMVQSEPAYVASSTSAANTAIPQQLHRVASRVSEPATSPTSSSNLRRDMSCGRLQEMPPPAPTTTPSSPRRGWGPAAAVATLVWGTSPRPGSNMALAPSTRPASAHPNNSAGSPTAATSTLLSLRSQSVFSAATGGADSTSYVSTAVSIKDTVGPSGFVRQHSRRTSMPSGLTPTPVSPTLRASRWGSTGGISFFVSGKSTAAVQGPPSSPAAGVGMGTLATTPALAGGRSQAAVQEPGTGSSPGAGVGSLASSLCISGYAPGRALTTTQGPGSSPAASIAVGTLASTPVLASGRPQTAAQESGGGSSPGAGIGILVNSPSITASFMISTSRSPRTSSAEALEETASSAMTPANTPRYRLSIGPIKTQKSVETPAVHQTLDI